MNGFLKMDQTIVSDTTGLLESAGILGYNLKMARH